MTECPKCKSEINYLLYYEEKGATFELNDGKAIYGESEYIADSLAFECPECSERLFDNEEDAVKFLAKRKTRN